MSKQEQQHWRIKYRPYLVAVVLAFVMTMLIAPVMQDGDAMAPTIRDGEVIVIRKEKFSAKRGVPEFQEMVCFYRDFIEEGEKGEQTVSRVIGCPGDRIQIEDGVIRRNGEILSDEPYAVGETVTEEPIDVTLGTEEIFVLGDNRQQATDSRDPRVGPLELKTIRGKCIFRVWPINRMGRIKAEI